jgi:kynurenine formamidase
VLEKAVMKFKTFVVGYALALAVFLFAQHRSAPASASGYKHVIDLTHTFSPTAPAETSHRSTARLLRADAIAESYRSQSGLSDPAPGTYLDAPALFAGGLWTADQIPAGRLAAAMVVLDVRDQVRGNPDYRVSVDDIAKWETAHGPIPQAAVVLARTGWDARWNNPRTYRNADANGIMHFPGFSQEAARFLVEGRNALALGIDTPSVDGNSKDPAVHRYAASRSVYQLQNVAGLDFVPAAGGLLIVAPIKSAGSSSAPVRLLAMVP